MRAKVIKPFNGWNEADPAPRDFSVGEEIDGNIAYQAVKAEFAEWLSAPSEAQLDHLNVQTPPAYTVQPAGTERPAPGDNPDIAARLAPAVQQQPAPDDGKQKSRKG